MRRIGTVIVRSNIYLFLGSALSVLAIASESPAQTLPTGGSMVAGAATITTTGPDMTVSQNSARAIVNWDSFSIGSANQVRFENGSGATLNRVTGPAVSSIDGRLSASGSVYLINPNGVVVGASGIVNVGGNFVASTLDTDEAAFLKGGDLVFIGNSGASVINLGSIGGLGTQVALIAKQVENRGTLSAPNGSAGLLAGTDILLSDQALDGGRFQVRFGGSGTSVANGGTVSGAIAELRANGGNVYALAGNVDGVVRATGVTARDGRIFLTAGDTGSVTLAGEITAQGLTGTAGAVETSGGTVALGNVAIDAHGGRWTIGAGAFAVDQSAADIIAASLNEGTGVTIGSTGLGGASGDIAVDPAVALNWSGAAALTLSAQRNIILGAGSSLSATGAAPITLYADSAGSGTGTVSYGVGASVATAGKVDIFYNRAVSGSTTPTDYAPLVTGGTLTPYMLVNSIADLETINDGLSGIYALGRDLDNGGAAFTPIGSDGSPFTGIFNGQGHDIANIAITQALSIRRIYAQSVGLFAATQDAAISDLHLVGGLVTAGDARSQNNGGGVGTLIGTMNGGTLDRVTSSTALKVTNATNAGGLVGRSSGTITNATASGTITANSTAISTSYYDPYNGDVRVGGLVGFNEGLIEDSAATGSISLKFEYLDLLGNPSTYGSAGGFVYDNYGTIRRSYSSGSLSAAGGYSGGSLGGFVVSNDGLIENAYTTSSVSKSYGERDFLLASYMVGGFAAANFGTITNAFASGKVEGVRERTGGFVGSNYGTLINAYWDIQTTGQSYGVLHPLYDPSPIGTVTNFVGLNGGAAYKQASYTGFDFSANGTWFMLEGQTRPFLRSEYDTTITNAHQLQLIAMDLNADYVLANDISLVETQQIGGLWNPNIGFAPIGQAGFNGSLDGQGHSVSGALIAYYDSDVIGLFGGIGRQGLVTDLTLSGLSIRGRDNVGVLAGYNLGQVSDVHVQSVDIYARTGVGGLVGYNAGTITGSTSSALITANSNVGGLVGTNGGTIIGSSASGFLPFDFMSMNQAGGLVGYNGGLVLGSSADINLSSYSNSRFMVGGLVGSNAGKVENSTATGSLVTTNGRYLGGLVGYNNGLVIGSTADILVEGKEAVGDLVGFNEYNGRIIGSSSSGDVAASTHVGGLVGLNKGTISASSSSATVRSLNPLSAYPMGGLVGYNSGSITTSSSSGLVNMSGPNSGEHVGGLVGENFGQISRSYSTATVGGITGVGGLVGYNAGSLSDVYATGPVSYRSPYAYPVTFTAGGLVGENQASGMIERAYASGAVEVRGVSGGFAGVNSGLIAASYYDGAASGQASGIGSAPSGTAAVTALGSGTGHDVTAPASYAGFDFGAVWTTDGSHRPMLQANPQSPPPE